ncbi:RluA family pseudouridine synthase [Shuttleworthella satelles]|uniref:RluA family pseudouridine synthase n=1 Tax=Shuttleworthella satelles TaxID=177972 RepID=UPI0028D1D063|nr:RluA family pseudouridine synthase [Shuttleworthia satelles]
MKRILTYENELNYDSIYDWLREKMRFPRSIVAALRSGEQDYRVNGKKPVLWQPLPAGSRIQIILEDRKSSAFAPVNLPLNIIYEDEDILLIDKPAGMPSHPSMNHQKDTLANAVLYYYQKQGIPFVFRIANRLDMDTSGLVAVSKNSLAAARVKQMIDKRQIHREYLCIVEGSFSADSSLTKRDFAEMRYDADGKMIGGRIWAPISRREGSVLERRVNASDGQTALTDFEIIQEGAKYSLLRVWLGTGRTHQIRVHMNYLGHPLPADYLYHPVYQDISRQPLHSAKLRFPHPVSGRQMCFESRLPADMRHLLDNFHS